MKSKASAPGKVILFGEHFVVYGVKAILCAIDKRITVIAEKITDNKIIINSEIGTIITHPRKSINEIDNSLKPFYFLADKMIQKFKDNSGLKITIESEIPLGVGLGSSSACCVAGAAAISGIYEKESKEDILKLAIEAEKTIFPNTSGADCTVCTYGGLIQYDKNSGHAKINSEPNFNLVIVNSKMEHSTKEVVSNVKEFKEKNETRFSQICKEESQLIEETLEYLKKNQLKQIGENIKKNQKYLDIIGISNAKLKNMILVADEVSFGSKITGAGGGGCIFALTDETNKKNTIEKLKENNYECFSVKIDFKGLDTF